MNDDARRHTEQPGRASSARWVVALVVLAAVAMQLPWVFSLQWRVDETVHAPIIVALAAGEWHEKLDVLTMLPAYHQMMAWIVSLSGAESIGALRVLAMLASLGIVPAAWWLIGRWNPQLPDADRAMRTLQVFALPLMFPFLFLVYTDVPAAALLIAALAAWLAALPATASGLLVLAVAFRFQSIVLAGAVLALWGAGRILRLEWARAWAQPRVWPGPAALAMLGIAFVAFVIANGGVALGDAGSHPLGLYLGNLWLAGLLGGWLMLPLALADWRRILARMRAPATALAAPAAMLAFIAAFSAAHPFNDLGLDFFLRNAFILWLEESPWHRALVAPLLGVLVLLVPGVLKTPEGIPRWDAVLLLAASAATLLPSWLVEQRYLIPLFVLFNCIRSPAVPNAERFLLVWWIANTGCITAIVASGRGFP